MTYDVSTRAGRIEPERSLNDDAPAASAANHKMVLVVDDSAAVRHELRQVLSAAEFEVIEAPDGEQAIRMIQTHPHLALVICDVNMPVRNGLEVLQHVKADAVTAAIRVVMLTTEGRPELIHQAKRAGASGWIIKPFKADLLVAAVNKLTAS